MYIKTKLRRTQDPQKFEEIYKELEQVYTNEFSYIAKKLGLGKLFV